MKELKKDFEMIFGGCDEHKPQALKCALHAIPEEDDENIRLLEQPAEEELQ